MKISDKFKFLSKISWLHIFLLALVPRLGFLVYWQKKNLESFFLHDEYIELAQYWLGWNIVPTESILHSPAPGFAFICAIIFKIMGHPNLLAIQMANVLFSSVTCVLIGILAKWLTDELTARLAALLAVLSPAFIFFSPHLQSESFFVFIEVLFFMGLFKCCQSGTWKTMLLLGVFGGLLSLTRSAFVIYLPFLCLALIIQNYLKKRSVFVVALLMIGWMLPISMWAISNWVRYQKFIPLTVQSGQGLYFGLARSGEEREQMKVKLIQECKELGYGPHNWIARDKFLRDRSIQYIKQHRLEYLTTVLINNFRFWRPWPYPPYPLSTRIVLGIFYSTVFMLCLIGVFSLRGKLIDFLPILFYFAGSTVGHSFFDVTFRYRVPLEPFLCIFAAAGLGALFFTRNNDHLVPGIEAKR
jgi:4-amino-4-deoxy-L-arabinose transferase-like glycosyltransferase